MKHRLRTTFQNTNFVVGFSILVLLLLLTFVTPFFMQGSPLDMVGTLFNKPGNYVNRMGVIDAPKYPLSIEVASIRLGAAVSDEEAAQMLEWLEKSELDVEWQGLDAETNHAEIVEMFLSNYDADIRLPGTSAYRKSFNRLYLKVQNLLSVDGYVVQVEDPGSDSGYREVSRVESRDFTNVKDVAARRFFLLGTDNFGRDVFHELISAIGNSLMVGLIAGSIATTIGLLIGLTSGYVGGRLDNFLTFVTNMFTVIPSFVILILLSYSISSSSRSIVVVAFVIGLTAWPWTARSVRSQTLTLKNRDHVNISRLSGFGTVRIIVTDILPYVLSYVVMAYILQISSAILAEAQLSMLGLGPSTTTHATLGLMLSWSMQFQAPLSGAWWAFIPVVLSIALISFSMNLMNTGLDQVFNPTLR